MTNSKDALRRYQQRTRELLVRRALGVLSEEDEGEIAESLDDIWRELSGEQQQQLEIWLAVELQPPPNSVVHEQSLAVEAADVTLAPRSA